MPTVTREIVIDAPAEAVWRHLADPEQRRRWMGGELDVDLAPGRRGTFADDTGARPVRIDAVEPGRSVTFTWGEGSTVTIEVAPDDDGSRVRVTESADVEHLADPAAPATPSMPSAPSTPAEQPSPAPEGPGTGDGDVVASVVVLRPHREQQHRRATRSVERLVA